MCEGVCQGVPGPYGDPCVQPAHPSLKTRHFVAVEGIALVVLSNVDCRHSASDCCCIWAAWSTTECVAVLKLEEHVVEGRGAQCHTDWYKVKDRGSENA